MKTFYYDSDGHTYFLREGKLFACLTFLNGTPDWDCELFADEYDVPLKPEQKAFILAKMSE